MFVFAPSTSFLFSKFHLFPAILLTLCVFSPRWSPLVGTKASRNTIQIYLSIQISTLAWFGTRVQQLWWHGTLEKVGITRLTSWAVGIKYILFKPISHLALESLETFSVSDLFLFSCRETPFGSLSHLVFCQSCQFFQFFLPSFWFHNHHTHHVSFLFWLHGFEMSVLIPEGSLSEFSHLTGSPCHVSVVKFLRCSLTFLKCVWICETSISFLFCPISLKILSFQN